MKDLFGIAGVVFLVVSLVPYLMAVSKKTARPHAFSWILWGSIQAIVFAAQVAEGAGAGGWTTGVTALINFVIAYCALRHSKIEFTRSDWAVFISALAAIPLWVVTKDPLWSVILVSVIDTVAFWPTLRKSWNNPHSEVVLTFVLGFFGFSFAIAALENYSLTNWLYPATVLTTNTAFIGVLLYRRHVLS